MAEDNLNPNGPPNSPAPDARRANWWTTRDKRELDASEHEDAVGTGASPGMRCRATQRS
jgi:hypothetical protein